MVAIQTVLVGQEALYNVSMDFAGQNITIEPQEVLVTDDYTMRWTFLSKSGGEGWGAVYVHELPLLQPLDNMKRALVWGMETACANVTAEPCAVDGREGWIGTGIYRDGGVRNEVEHGTRYQFKPAQGTCPPSMSGGRGLRLDWDWPKRRNWSCLR